MRSLMLVDGTDLDGWANRRDAQGDLPKLVRKLILASASRISRISFPAGEGVQIGGWDGIVTAEGDNAFVPAGTSVWEMSTNKDIKGKADRDYEKRRSNSRGIDPSQSTFTFVTPRRWSKKSDWVDARTKEGLWRAVRAYDADDLETWLELAPVVHTWVSILLGKHPPDALDLENFWADWSETTRPATTPELVLAGRVDVVGRVHTWIRDPSSSIALQAESRDEALAVFVAALRQLSPDEGALHLARAVIVNNVSGWNWLTASKETLTLIPRFDVGDALSRAIRNGHRVVITLGRADGASSTAITVPRLGQEDATKALVACGVTDESAREHAALARKSIMSFRRKLALRPEVHQPQWARPSEGRSLLPAMLMGSWSDSNELDRQAISKLAQRSYEEVSDVLVRWSNETDPPVRRVGDSWYLTSLEDACALLMRYVTREDLARFEEVVLDVLGIPDPCFEPGHDQQWISGALSGPPKYSALLYKGLADVLAMLATLDNTSLPPSGISTSECAARIVRRLLKRANADWRIWASLPLSNLAEAAPDVFLSAVDEGLAGGQPVLLALFADDERTLFSSSPHTRLLWALETLAWSPEHLGRAVILLSKLAKLDPGGQTYNRPENSLREIFLPWHPQTTANLEQRFRVLDTIRKRAPEVTWELMCKLLPEHHSMGRPTSKPRWREWASDPPSTATRVEYAKAVGEVVGRMLEDAGMSGARWGSLVGALDSLSGEQYDRIVDSIAELDPNCLAEADRVTLWDVLRKLVSRHRTSSDADWALPGDRVDRLDEIRQAFEPSDPFARSGWLFSDWPELPEGRDDDYEACQAVIDNERLAAVGEVYAEQGLSGLVEFAGRVELPGVLGFTVGQCQLLEHEQDQLLRDHLASDDASRAQFAKGFGQGVIRRQGRGWAETKLASVAEVWSPSQCAELLLCLPLDGATWDFAGSLAPDHDTERLYWERVRPYGIEADLVERAAKKLIDCDRPFSAVDLLGLNARRKISLPPALIADALESALQSSPENDLPLSSFSHNVSELLDALEGSKEFDESRIAAIEWGFLPVLGRDERAPKLLHRELARCPQFFAELVALVFRSEGAESRDVSDDAEARASQAYNLLTSWRTVPGSGDDGTIRADELKAWVQSAREAITASGRVATGEQMIGQVLSGSPVGADGAWPHESVRDLLEELACEDIEVGFKMGLYNSRGIVSRGLTDGGVQERELADRYAGFATQCCDRWPRTAATLRRIADGYREEGRFEDQRAELREDLGP